MDEFKIIEVFINYFGETGSLVIMIFLIAYGLFKYYILKRQSDMMNRIESYLKTLAQKYSDTITYEQAEVVVRDVYFSSACELLDEVIDIIQRNNIDKEWKSIVAKIKDLIDIRYAEDYSKLTKFIYNDYCLAEIMENSRRDYLHEGITNIIEKHRGESAIKQNQSFIKNSLMKFCNDDMRKIDKRKKK